MSTTDCLAKIEPGHLPAVAEVHIKAFRGSALTRLGKESVRRYYEWQLCGPHSHEFVGVFDNGELRGFAVGGISRCAMSGFVRRNAAFLCWTVLSHPWLFIGPLFRRRLGLGIRVFSRTTKTQPAPQPSQRSFGILAIAVHPGLQERGLGRILMDQMETVAKTEKFTRMHLTVAKDNAQAIAFYERLGWSKSLDGTTWEGRMQKELKPGWAMRKGTTMSALCAASCDREK